MYAKLNYMAAGTIKHFLVRTMMLLTMQMKRGELESLFTPTKMVNAMIYQPPVIKTML